MKRLLHLLLFYSSLSMAQVPIDSLKQVNDTLNPIISNAIINSADSLVVTGKEEFFSDSDLKVIDSLLIEEKFNSSLFEGVQYVINDKDIVGSTTAILSEELLKKRLKELDNKTPFNLAYNPALVKEINRYLKYRKRYYPALMAKAEYYFPMFEQYLDQFDVPIEMKYLSIVESALRPRARSYVGATGLWQFMYGTGRQFNLNVSSYVDERQDPVKSTVAACKYLSQLYKIFGDWDLALAAYNSGPGNVSKAIKRSGGYKNYWNIRPFLPRETAAYVPAFYATMYIFEYAEKHDLYPESPDVFHFETDTIRVKRTISFEQISQKVNVDEEVLTFLNPEYKLNTIPYVEGRNYAVRLPKKRIIDFLDKEKEIYEMAKEDEEKGEKPLPKYFEMDQRIVYRVKSGDYLGKIANKFGVRVRDIKRWNGMRTHNLKIGQRLSIHPKRLAIPKSVSKKKKKKALPKGNHEVYTVQQGDSLWSISKKFSPVSIEQLREWNDFWGKKSLKPGMKLKIFKS
ncbi:membrane-bound lytic murein transglycosylase D [Tenacibaculum sp. MAR_2009_124]|uniref:lytic transglycosylase domain-containing protein n=1 Tax=Tenacibaculum sp. MAR_2009_124 TaxID=1250059 RepID=UPI00089AD187|nr:lytic transglycosylase domain-containing protein [Tenacibaculum sp. MAR_2009_124]SEC36320.1 membrane-bound lytic murein transglycosylase D [Tenacibaculum sp. MAR_2009_124]